MARDLLHTLPLGGEDGCNGEEENREVSVLLIGTRPYAGRVSPQSWHELLARDTYDRIPLWLTIPLFLAVILLGVASDAIGFANARATEQALLSMATRLVPGAREAVWYVRNVSGVSSVFSDLMGDVSATLGGALAVAVALRLRGYFPETSGIYLASIAAGVAAGLSIGGKALSKPFALKYAETIILLFGKMRRLWLAVLGGKSGNR